MDLYSGSSGFTPKAAWTRPRAPAEANGRKRSSGSGACPCCARMRFTAAARSGAVSASVPSKSKSTARLGITRASQEVVHIAVAPEAVAAGDRVVAHSDELIGAKPGGAAPARKLRRLDEALVVVRAFRQQAEHVLRADHGEKIRLGIAVDGGEKGLPVRAH